jgi:hypothetical protein
MHAAYMCVDTVIACVCVWWQVNMHTKSARVQPETAKPLPDMLLQCFIPLNLQRSVACTAEAALRPGGP